MACAGGPGGTITWSAKLAAPPFASYPLGPISPAQSGDVYVSEASIASNKSSSIHQFSPMGVHVGTIVGFSGVNGISPPMFLGTDPLGDVLYSYHAYGASAYEYASAVKRPPGGTGIKSLDFSYLGPGNVNALMFGIQGGDGMGRWLVDAAINPGPGCISNCGYDFGNGLEIGNRLLRYDACGAYLGSIPSPGDWRLAPSGDLYVVKGFTGTTDIGCGPVAGGSGQSTLLAKLDIDGACIWSKAFSAPAPAAFTLGGDGSILFAVVHTGSIDFGGGALPDFGGENLTIAKMDLAGNVMMTRTVGGAGSSFSNITLESAPSGIVALAGNFAGTVDLGAGPIGNAGDTLLAAFDPAGALRWSKVVNVGTTAYNFAQSTLRMTRQPCSMVVVTNSPTVDLGAGPVVAVPPPNNSPSIAVVGLSL